jgi:hypothetical protein
VKKTGYWVIKDRVVRIIFGPKGDKVIGDLRKLHNKELHNLCSTPNIIWVIILKRA